MIKVVTGSSGFIAGALIEKNKFKNCFGIDRQAKLKYTNCVGNLNKIDLNKILKSKKISYFYHFGGHSNLSYKHSFTKCFNEDLTSLINILNFLEKNKKNKIKFIYSSSSYVYQNNMIKKNIREEDYLNPNNGFGVAKIIFENLIKYKYPNSVILRISSVFGKNAIKHPNLINNMYLSSKKNNEIEIWGSGKRYLQFININNLIESIIKIDQKFIPGIYNIGSKSNYTTKEIANIISLEFDKKINIKYKKNIKEGESLPLMSIDKITKNKKINILDLNNQIINFCNEMKNNEQ